MELHLPGMHFCSRRQGSDQQVFFVFSALAYTTWMQHVIVLGGSIMITAISSPMNTIEVWTSVYLL